MESQPDISEFVEAQELLEAAEVELDSARGNLREVEGFVVESYRALDIPQEDCDHPVTRYAGNGENQCRCCDKYGV